MITNLIIAAFVIAESAGNWSKPGDDGRALGGLQIQAIMVEHYNQATKSQVVHEQVKDPETAYKIARWFFDYSHKKYKRTLTVAELYQCWNAGPDAVKRQQSIDRGQRVARIYAEISAKKQIDTFAQRVKLNETKKGG